MSSISHQGTYLISLTKSGNSMGNAFYKTNNKDNKI